MPDPKLHRDETESGIKDRKRHQTALIWREIEALRGQSVAQLRGKYLEVFGHESRSNHKQFCCAGSVCFLVHLGSASNPGFTKPVYYRVGPFVRVPS
jgi:hypothetical protein